MYMTINIQTSSALTPLGQSKPNYVEDRYEGAMKTRINGQGHMTKMAAMAINSKNLYQNQKAYDFETWHKASGNGALGNLLAHLSRRLTR